MIISEGVMEVFTILLLISLTTVRSVEPQSCNPAVVSYVVRDEKGQINRWYVASTDIEDRKRAEEKLQLENAALREEIDQTSMFEEIVGTSAALHALIGKMHSCPSASESLPR